MDIAPSQLRDARILAEEILRSFEERSSPISENLMKTIRLARLLNDIDAEKWLEYEIQGLSIERIQFFDSRFL